MTKWIKTQFPGVRYRKHPTRQKRGVGLDQYFTIRHKVAGKDREEGLGWATEGWTAAKAYERLKELKENRKVGEGPQTLAEKRQIERTAREKKKKDSVTFGEYFENHYYPRSKIGKKDESSRKELEHFNKWIRPAIGKIPLKDIKPIHCEKIKKAILCEKIEKGITKAGNSPRSLQYVFATIRQAWNLARRDGHVTGDSPTKQVKVPKVDNRRVRFLSHEEARALLNALRAKDTLTHDLAMLSLHTGLRVGEMASLKWSHIDLDRGIITIMDPKGGKGRVAFMTEPVKTMLEGMKRRGPNDSVFTKQDGERLTDMPRIFFEIVEDLGLNEGITDRRQKVVAHSLRHTFASWHVEAGTDIYTLKELMGHSVIAMTERYAHLSNGTLHNATLNLEKAIEGAGQKKAGQVVNFKD